MAYSAFVSSTFEDLKDHRAHVIRALREAGFFVDPMEDWTSSKDEPKVFSKKRVEGCDLCILLVALRRGHKPTGETRSITQLEHREAEKLGIDVLAFLLDEDALWKRKFDELDTDDELTTWRGELQERYGVSFFDHEPASVKVAPALTRWLQEREERDRAREKTGERPAEPAPATGDADPSRYLKAVSARHSTIELRGMGAQVAERVPLERVYIRLRVGRPGGRAPPRLS